MEIVVEAARELYTDEEWAELTEGTDRVTRCRDCVHAKEYGIALLCQRMQRTTMPSDFCSRGAANGTSSPGWRFQFPLHVNAHIGDWSDINLQLAKIGEELCECVREACGKNSDDLTMELMDVIHAAETALVIVNGHDIAYLSRKKKQTIEKNEERGYYGVPD